ncbi:MAG: hypothetical protein K2H97_07775 [Prevotella sp.]|nr:hypothetical protein [Prevotella sp.]
MKKYFFALSMFVASSVATFANNVYSAIELPDADSTNVVFSVSDPEFEWSQTDTKKIKVLLNAEGLKFESKEDDGVALSIVELPINVENNREFIFGVNIQGPKLDDKKSFGLLFDYEDGRNYKGLTIFKKQYEYFVVKDGVRSSVKTGLVKFKGTTYKLNVKRENGGMEFTLNDIEVCKLRRISIASSYFGVYICGKMKALMPDFIMYVPDQEDIEQSTTDI